MSSPSEEAGVEITPSLRIPLSELQFRFGPSGGPGGQHANKVATRVELRFDVAASAALGPRQRERLLDRLGSEVRVVVDEERSQARNRRLAVERLRERLAARSGSRSRDVRLVLRQARPSAGSPKSAASRSVKRARRPPIEE